MIKFSLLVFFAIAASSIIADQVSYENYQVFRVTPRNQEAAALLHDLEENHVEYDFWTRVVAVDVPVDVMVPPHLKEEFHNFIEKAAFNVEVYIENVQSLIEAERPKGVRPRELEWSSYHELDEVSWIGTDRYFKDACG